MIKINWTEDYQKEFACPECDSKGLRLSGTAENCKRVFYCSVCKKSQVESIDINIEPINDPINQGVIWYSNHRIADFICPKCQSREVYFNIIVRNKKRFVCRACRFIINDSIVLTSENISRFSGQPLAVKGFNFSNDVWDLRAINVNVNERDTGYYNVNFTDIHLDWFKQKVKKYIQHSCNSENSPRYINTQLGSLRTFSTYLTRNNVSTFEEINRNLIIDYLSQEDKLYTNKIGALRDFFRVGTLKGWFNIDQDIIRNADYPKYRQSNPDTISDVVREKIEQNLCRLPDTIARMWLICYATAMRPSELALLKQDCLLQDGHRWKIVWHRIKTNDYHEIPISRTIAKVVQEQQEYIKNLWGEEWNYLFCHYTSMSRIDVSQPKLKPVKKVLCSSEKNTLIVGIRTLIKILDIRDENGKLAKFQVKLLRSTRATNLFEEGHDLAVVSAWLKHKSFATTSTYYTHVSCSLMEREAGHIQKALVNSNGHRLAYESFPKSFWENPTAHKLELSDTHINTPIYGYCGLPLDQDCHKFRACYTCQSFVATIDKLPEYINVREELRGKQAKAMSAGQEVLVEQFGTQADRLDEIIAGLHQEAA
jgi:integrase